MAGHRSEGDGRHDHRGGTDGNELTVIASDLYQDMTIAFPERYDCGSDAVCGSSDEPIAFRDPILVPTWSEDPPMLSVSDAAATEGHDDALEFVVSMHRTRGLLRGSTTPRRAARPRRGTTTPPRPAP